MKMSIIRVDPLSIEIPKKPPNKSASEHRKATKPMMEKRRRARINNCLEQIKSLILLALNKDPAKNAKLEKADILEMTVEYLKSINQAQPIDKSSAIKSLKAGFDECASEVERFVNITPDVDLAMKRRIKSHLKNNFSTLTSNTNINNNFVSSTTSSNSSMMDSTSPAHSPLNMKTEPLSPLTVNRDVLTTISFNYNIQPNLNCNNDKSHPDTPPPSATLNKTFKFPPASYNNLHQSQYVNHLNSPSTNYIISPISPTSPMNDEMDCTPVDCSKSSKLNHLNEKVWRPW